MVVLIIFGSRGVTYSAESGQFHCPGCEQRRDYQHKRVRRFFTLYFIPLIPLDLLGEYVECSGCRGTYKPAILEYDPRESERRNEAEFQQATRRVMVLMMLADGNVDEAEMASIQDLLGKVSKRTVERAEIESEIAAARKDSKSVEDYCRGMTGYLNESGKEMVVRAALMVAAADGKFEDAEKELLARIAKALELSSAHFRGILAEATESKAA